MEIVERYKAKDGCIFADKSACERYEEQLVKKEEMRGKMKTLADEYELLVGEYVQLFPERRKILSLF